MSKLLTHSVSLSSFENGNENAYFQMLSQEFNEIILKPLAKYLAQKVIETQ